MAAQSTLCNNPPTGIAIAGLLLDTRIELAYNQWKEANSKSKGSLSVNKAAKNYYIVKSTLRRRITGGASRKQAS
jgi:hypothetical protein